MIYYKVVGHLEDREQGTGTFVFNDEQPLEYIEKKNLKKNYLKQKVTMLKIFKTSKILEDNVISIIFLNLINQ